MNTVADCERCKMNIGSLGFPICKYEELDEKDGYMNVSSQEIDTIYTKDCVRFEEQ